MKLISKLMENVPIVSEEIMNSQIPERFPELTLQPEDSALYLLAYLSTHSINFSLAQRIQLKTSFKFGQTLCLSS